MLIRDLLFADDCALLAHTVGDIQAITNAFARSAHRFGMTISLKKTEVIYQPKPGADYTAPTITMRQRGVRLVTKINVYCAVVLPTLLYGSEAWTPYRRHIRRLDQFHMRCRRRIANIKWQYMIPNTDVLQRYAHTGIEHHIKRSQLRWSGHLVRMADDRIPKAGHRTRGGQRKQYNDVLKATLKSCGIPTTPGRPLRQCPLVLYLPLRSTRLRRKEVRRPEG